MRRVAAILLFTLAARAQTVDEIVALVIASRGGAAKLRAVETQRLKGRITLNNESGSLYVEIKRPSSIREEFRAGLTRVVRATDGKTGWSKVGDEPVKALSEADVRALAASADLDGPLLDYKTKGNQVVLAGTVELEGRRQFKLAVTLKNGTARTDYIDARTFLETKWAGTISDGGRQLDVESVFRDYRTVDGIACAFRIESLTPALDVKQEIVFESIENNAPIPDSRFARPQ